MHIAKHMRALKTTIGVACSMQLMKRIAKRACFVRVERSIDRTARGLYDHDALARRVDAHDHRQARMIGLSEGARTRERCLVEREEGRSPRKPWIVRWTFLGSSGFWLIGRGAPMLLRCVGLSPLGIDGRRPGQGEQKLHGRPRIHGARFGLRMKHRQDGSIMPRIKVSMAIARPWSLWRWVCRFIERLRPLGQGTGQYLPEHHADGVAIALDRCRMPLPLLGAHIRERAEPACRGRCGRIAEVRNAKVPKPCDASIVEENVRGLYVAMEDPKPMGLMECVKHSQGNLDGAGSGEGLGGEHVLEGSAAHPAHDKRRALLGYISKRDDMGMHEGTEDIGFAPKASERIATFPAKRKPREHFDRDAVSTRLIEAFKDARMRRRRNLAMDAIATKQSWLNRGARFG